MIDKEPVPNSFQSKDSGAIPETEMAQIESLIEELVVFEKNNPPDERVDRAFASIDEVIDEQRDYFIRKKILITYHGSLQFNDPRQLDLDLVFTSQDGLTLHQGQHIIQRLEEEFELVEDWPEIGENEGKCDTNFTSFSMEELDDDLMNIVAEDRKIDDEKDFIDLHITYLLTSKALFSDQEELLAEFKTQAKELLSQSQILRESVISVLQKIIETRRERKKQHD